ncbi:hypothetical protein FHQ26_07280 [Testudinibacter sp. TR-2022]|uniref:hypothetical protein n=1 Tax=Testudinibacter sp. TR-2022 TaxID=2585029 RepID=UPI00111A50FD|nr:hypothetical protein [Testudinibacter sp. TR-2022]TNH00041.1 hypothetical protein FHQ22_12315 [Pasteurellaceae bacterium Phil31]TNH08080.1 hypothetical protein FHQ25_10100 [Testudinibacter sp. TR-2022]TNH09215.1 hypothetical protein FHQ26_07280 [Testudinibacter sp. TR-2022]TNH10312.1 hypothetical protein FIA56_12220 [Testudinibacter sp. TR-2022]TNH13508.1 hypothetical protein FHQ23_11950 [Testudinibacter sp. TR-2022]
MSLKKTMLLVTACSTVLIACSHSADNQVAVKDYQEPILAAKWINYQCENGVDQKQAKARYHFGEATAVAQVTLGEEILTMDYDGDKSNPETTVFSVGDYSWSISNNGAGQTPEKEGNGFLTLTKNDTVNGAAVKVDQILKKSCFPAK